MIRQALWGGTYGLINEQNGEVRPDYGASLAWKQLMGNKVLEVDSDWIDDNAPSMGSSIEGPRELISMYAHCHPISGVTLLVINPTATSYKIITLAGDSVLNEHYEQVTLSPDPLSLIHESDRLLGVRR